MLRFCSANPHSDKTMVFRYLACLNSQTGKPLPLAKAQSREEQQKPEKRDVRQ